jgi:TPR repeat protein
VPKEVVAQNRRAGNAEGLGLIYAVQQNYAEAAKWLRQAAEQENSEVQARLVALHARFPALHSEDASPLSAALGNVASPTMPKAESLLIFAVQRARVRGRR